MVTTAPIKMVIRGGWFIIVLTTLVAAITLSFFNGNPNKDITKIFEKCFEDGLDGITSGFEGFQEICCTSLGMGE